jgi:hypothetical protein
LAAGLVAQHDFVGSGVAIWQHEEVCSEPQPPGAQAQTGAAENGATTIASAKSQCRWKCITAAMPAFYA